jgi:hypothetical protein
LEAAWKRFGSQPWAQLVKPAADLARTGFAAHPYLVYIMSGEANLRRMKVSCLCVVLGLLQLHGLGCQLAGQQMLGVCIDTHSWAASHLLLQSVFF